MQERGINYLAKLKNWCYMHFSEGVDLFIMFMMCPWKQNETMLPRPSYFERSEIVNFNLGSIM